MEKNKGKAVEIDLIHPNHHLCFICYILFLHIIYYYVYMLIVPCNYLYCRTYTLYLSCTLIQQHRQLYKSELLQPPCMSRQTPLLHFVNHPTAVPLSNGLPLYSGCFRDLLQFTRFILVRFDLHSLSFHPHSILFYSKLSIWIRLLLSKGIIALFFRYLQGIPVR